MEIELCDLCGKKMRLIRPQPGQHFKPFLGCSGYPNCKSTKRFDSGEPQKKEPVEELVKKEKIDYTIKTKEIEKKRSKLERQVTSSTTPQTFPYHQFPFESFNPAQKLVLEYIDQNVNLVICAKTSAGKTAIAEMVMSRTLTEGSRCIYLSPLRALSQEKYDRWNAESHSFSKYRKCLLTGDVLADSGIDTLLARSQIVVQTSEILHHKSLHLNKRNVYLAEVGCLIVDEAHLIDEKSRGSELECGLELFSRINPSCRIIFLSATMENSDEIAKWLQVLNGKQTAVIKSDFRPCQLHVEYIPVESVKGNARESDEIKADTAIGLVLDHPEDQFILFVHSKRQGYVLTEKLNTIGIEAKFHSRDASRKIRNEIESNFLNGELKTVVSTPTLAMGLDLPAKRVVVLGTKRGPEKVEHGTISQMIGRAGRPAYDKEGFAYILLDEENFEQEKKRLNQPFIIHSSLSKIDNLTFHLLMIIYNGAKTEQDIYKWYRRTLSYIQNSDIDDVTLKQIITTLTNMTMIKLNQDNDQLEITNLGKICCWFYMNPFDIYGWKKSFTFLHRNKLWSTESIIWALSYAGSCKNDISNSTEQSDCGLIGFRKKLPIKITEDLTPGQIKHATALYCLMGCDTMPNSLYSTSQQWKEGIERITTAIKTIDAMVSNWNLGDILDRISVCISKGVTYEQSELVTFKGIGKKRAEALFEKGITRMIDIMKNQSLVKELVGVKIGKKLIDQARAKLINQEET